MNNAKQKQLLKLYYQIKREKCASFFEFVKTFWGVIISEVPRWNWHIQYLCEQLEEVGYSIARREKKKHDLLINVPPATTKSTIITIMFPAWLWTIDASLRVISNSYASEISIEHAVKSRDIIQSALYQTLFPQVVIRKDKGGKQNYDTTANGARYTTSTGGAITGKHAHVIINDDPQNPKQAESEAHRKQSVEHTKTLASRKVDKDVTVTITVMQRLNTGDVSGFLLEKKSEGIKHIKLPAEITAKTAPIPATDTVNGTTIAQLYANAGGLLDATRLSPTAIAEAKIDLGVRGYNGQFLQNPTAEQGDIVKREWLSIVSRSVFESRLTHLTEFHFFLDTAYTESTENDPTGILVACKIDNTMYIFNRIKVHKEFPELVRFIPQFVRANRYNNQSTVRIEPKASGLSVIQTLQRETGLNVTKTPTPKDDKKTRLYSITPKLECGRVVLVEGAWNDDFIDEVCGFPNAPHDEDVDTLVYACNYFLTDEVSGEAVVSNILW